jgi:hypothetical protein
VEFDWVWDWELAAEVEPEAEAVRFGAESDVEDS